MQKNHLLVKAYPPGQATATPVTMNLGCCAHAGATQVLEGL